MSSTSRRVLISCAIMVLAIILCIGLIGLAGILIFSIYPPTTVEQAVTLTPGTANTSVPEILPELPSPTQIDPNTVSPVPTATSLPVPETSLPAEIIEQMNIIQGQVADLRGLEPLEDVDRYLLSPQQLREQVMDDFLEEYSPEDARDDALILAALGLLDPQFDLYDLYIELYSEQIVGYYDSETKEMYIIQGTEFSAPERLTYAHEYTHALQDQHHKIEEELRYEQEYCELNTEYCAAVQALLEGDSSLLEMQWLFTYASTQDFQEIEEYYANSESPIFEAAPSFLQEDFMFPYQYGYTFVETIYKEGGWPAVDRVYTNPPVSTEQILHPERYPDATPLSVELPDLLPILNGNWRELDRNVMGEWYIYLILAEALNEGNRLDQGRSQQAADGWAGDSYVVYYQDETNQTILVLKVIWKNEREARQFNEAFLDYASTRFGALTSSTEGSWSWEDDRTYSELNLDGIVTTWIIAPDANIAELIQNNLGTR